MHQLIFLLALVSSDLQADPKSDYLIHCMGCHLVDGQGMPPDVPAFNEELGGLASTIAGRAYLVQVPGSAQSFIDDAELAEVLNWIIETYSADSKPENFQRFTQTEVSSYRYQTMNDPVKIRLSLQETLQKGNH